MRKLSLKIALLKCFEDEPKHIFGIHELCAKVQKYYTFTEFQVELDPKHPQHRYEHQVRCQINRLKTEREIVYLAHNQYKLA